MVLFQAFRGVHCSGSMLVLLGCNKRQPLRLRLRHDHDMHFPKISVPFGGLGKCNNVCQTKVVKKLSRIGVKQRFKHCREGWTFPNNKLFVAKKMLSFSENATKQREGLNQRCVDQFKKYTLYPPHFWNTFVGFERNVLGLSHRCLLLIGLVLVGFPQVPPKNPIGAWSRLPKIIWTKKNVWLLTIQNVLCNLLMFDFILRIRPKKLSATLTV